CKAERAAKRKSNERAAAQDVSSVPAAVTHAVNLRDRGCCRAKLPDGTECGETRWVHHHHIVPKSQGAKDEVNNMISLCSAHHRLWHNGEGIYPGRCSRFVFLQPPIAALKTYCKSPKPIVIISDVDNTCI